MTIALSVFLVLFITLTVLLVLDHQHLATELKWFERRCVNCRNGKCR